MSADDGLREVIPHVRRYRGAPNILFGEPGVLKRLCRCFGFKNECPRGRVFITDAKIQRLEALGLPPATEPPPPEFSGAPASLDEAHAEARADRDAKLLPPRDGLIPFARMPVRERAFAALLAHKYGYRVEPSDWSYQPETGQVVVEVPGAAVVWSIVRGTLDQVLDELGKRGARTEVEEMINA